MSEPKYTREEILEAIDRLLISYEEDLSEYPDEIKQHEARGAIKALERLQRDLDMPKMISKYRRSLK